MVLQSAEIMPMGELCSFFSDLFEVLDMSNVSVLIQVFPYDEALGHKSGVSTAGRPYEFFEQQAVTDGGPGVPPVVFRLQHRKRPDVLNPGYYRADLRFWSDRYGQLQVAFKSFVPAQVNKPSQVA
ncbi:MAG: hypothetical protein JJ714_03200 [Acidithiobacillus sp.]|nr:hypothetical protein [Acidithiobacillus sp.]